MVEQYARNGQARQAINAARNFGWQNNKLAYTVSENIGNALPKDITIGVNLDDVKARLEDHIFIYRWKSGISRGILAAVDFHINEGRIMYFHDLLNSVLSIAPAVPGSNFRKIDGKTFFDHRGQVRFLLNAPVAAFNPDNYH
jgi:hypothetical protein